MYAHPRHLTLRTLVAGIVGFLLSGACMSVGQAMPIVKDVKQVIGVDIQLLCIETNQAVDKDNLDEIISAVVEQMGIKTQVKQSAFPGECEHWLRYTATWRGMLPSYLLAFELDVLENKQVLGYVRYDASQASGRPDRFGTTKGKVTPLLQKLLARIGKPDPI